MCRWIARLSVLHLIAFAILTRAGASAAQLCSESLLWEFPARSALHGLFQLQLPAASWAVVCALPILTIQWHFANLLLADCEINWPHHDLAQSEFGTLRCSGKWLGIVLPAPTACPALFLAWSSLIKPRSFHEIKPLTIGLINFL